MIVSPTLVARAGTAIPAASTNDSANRRGREAEIRSKLRNATKGPRWNNPLRSSRCADARKCPREALGPGIVAVGADVAGARLAQASPQLRVARERGHGFGERADIACSDHQSVVSVLHEPSSGSPDGI